MTPETLDELLAHWADRYRLSNAEAVAIRDAIYRADIGSVDSKDIDAAWLWNLLRPVTNLLDGPHPLYDTLMRGYA